MIYTVTLNPALDYFMDFDSIETGEVNRTKETRKLPGGKGIIESRMLALLGTENRSLGFLGGFAGNFIQDTLKNDGVHTDFVQIAAETRINVVIKTSDSETNYNAAGPVLTDSEVSAFFASFDQLKPGDIVALAGIVPPNLNKNVYDKLIDIIEAHGAEFAIDVDGKQVLAALPKKPIVVKPNKFELEEMFATKFDQKEDIIPYGQKMLGLGAQNVMVSMAGEGALLFAGDKVYFAAPVPGVIKNSVGAGDSTVAGFLSEWSKSKDPLKAFQQGVACGTAKVFSTDMPTHEFLEECYHKVSIQELHSTKN